ncbi:transporter associated domain protein, partial [Chlamydia psittaci 06-1683]
RYPC